MWLKEYFEFPVIRDEAKGKMLGEGIPLIPGIKSGPAVIGGNNAKPGSIVFDVYIIEVAKQVTDFDKVVHEINGVVTMQGTLADHASVSIKGTGVTIPYVTAVEDLIVPIENYIDGTDIIRFGDKQIQAGEIVTLDGNTGRVYRELTEEDFISSEVKRVLDRKLRPEQSTLYPYYAKVIEWIEKLNDDDPSDEGKDPTKDLSNLSSGASSPIDSKLPRGELQKGGIDFNPDYLNIQSQGNRVELPIPNNPQQFQNIEIKGLVPFIFNITPITDIPLLLGESEEQSDEFSLSQLH